MVLNPESFDYLEGDDTVFEQEPLQRLAAEGQLMGYHHSGFWQCMDTQREMKKLEELLSEEGDTNFVSIILIMVIVIAIAAIFSEQLKGAVDAVFGQLTEFIENKGQKY